jgi:hypothetical protein
MATATKKKPAKKVEPRGSKPAPKATAETVLVLRTCDKDLKAHGGFQWPEKGHVAAPDWKPAKKCGNGLHGLLWGEGDAGLLNWDASAKWLVVEVPAASVIDLTGKVKFPSGNVLHCGDRLTATDFLVARLKKSATVVGVSLKGGDRSTLTGGDRSTLTGGYGSTLTGGDGSTLTGGDRSTLTGGDRSTLTGGYGSTLTGGDGSTLTGGDGSTLTGGDGSTLVFKFYDATQDRRRVIVLEIGEAGILPRTKYRINERTCKPEVVE